MLKSFASFLNYRILAIILLPIVFSFSGFAQTEQQVIDRYLNGDLQITSQSEKDIISRYIDENVVNVHTFPRNVDDIRVPFFTEDFTGTAGDSLSSTPPAGWQNIVNTGGNPAQNWDFYTAIYHPGTSAYVIPSGGGFSGEYAVLDSDKFGSGNTQNTSLITPAINCTGRDNVYLSFSEQFRSIGTSSGTVSVSTDGGTIWTDLLVRTGVSVGYPNPAVETSIIVPQATNQADVRFRFTYEGTWGYWWAIDNVALEEGSALVPLVGGNSYPINGTENPPTSFENITSAIAYMNLNGVTGTGQVVLELATGYSGTEPGPISMGAISGTSTDLGITFRPAAGYTATTEIVGGASPNQHAFALAGASFITLDGRSGGLGTDRNWTIKVSGTTNAQMAVRLQNTAASMENITIRNLIMIGEAASITGAVFQTTGTTTNSMINVVVEDNLITSSATASSDTRGYGITIATNNAASTGMVIRNNDVTNFYARGINITSPNPYMKVHNNRFYHTVPITQPSVTEFSAIYFSSTSANAAGTEIYNNMIYGIQLTNHSTTTTVGINGIYFLTAPSGVDPVRVYNNMIVLGPNLTGTAADMQLYGIRENTSSTTNPVIDIYYNSIYIGGELTTGANNSAAFRKQLSSNLNLSNNIFFNARSNNGGTGTHWGIMTNNTNYSTISNNDYYANGTGGVLGTVDGTTSGNQLTLGDWLVAMGGADVASVSQNPNYLAPMATPPDLKINETIATQLESGGAPIAGITTDFEGDLRNATTPDIGADEFDGIFADLTPPAILYTSLSNTGSTANRDVTATITDPSGVQAGANGPRLYFKKNFDGTYLFDATPVVVGEDYTFTIDHTTLGVVAGDSVYYYFAAQDSLGNAGTSPPGGSGSNPPGTTPPDNPDFYLITPPALVGDYTVGLAMFRQFSGLDISFEKRVRTIEIVETIVNQEAQERMGIYEETINGTMTVQEPATEEELIPYTITRTIEQEYFVPVLNGEEYNGSLYHEFTAAQIAEFNLGTEGIYPTITSAIDDANLRGVGGAVRFLLVDAVYPSETFPIVIGEINGLSSTNTLSILPATGVTSTITGTIAQPIFDLNGTSYVTLDGRQNGVGEDNSLSIINLSTAANATCVRFINGATNNTIRNLNLEAQPSTSTTRAVELSSSVSNPAGNSNNLITYCDLKSGRYVIYFNGTAANPNDGNIISNNKIYDGTFTNMYVINGSSNTSIIDNEIFNVTAQSTANSAISLSTGATNGVNNIIGNKIYDIQNTGTSTVRGITGTPAANSTLNIHNNFISLTLDNGTKTSIYAIQISGTTEHTANIHYNSIRIGGAHTGGTAGQIISGGLIKSNTGATSTFNSKNNISINNRSGGTAGTFHTNFFAGSANLVGTLDIDYNVNFATGGDGAYHAGWAGFVYNDQQTYRDSAAPHEQHTIFKNVEFVSNTDLHLTGSSIGDQDLGGIPIAGITTDIDGDLRDPEIPYRGADESESLNIPPYLVIWERSDSQSNLPPWFGSSTERGLAYGFTNDGTDASNNRVYVVSSSPLAVRVLNAADGSDVGTLNVTNISGGLFALNDIEVTDDGMIMGANLTLDASVVANPFKVYMWSNELAAPVNVLSYNSAGTVRLGDKVTVTGDYNSGTAAIWAVSGTVATPVVFKWTMTGGVFNQVPEIITLSDSPSALGTASVGPLPSGEFWLNANGINPRKYQANGTLIGVVPGSVVATGSNAIRHLGQVGNNEYAVTFAYGAGNNNARVIEVPLGVPEDATLFFATPSLGSLANANGTGDVDFQINPDFTANIYVLTTNNGLGAYRSSDGVPVELSTFAANVVDRNVNLTWRTESETNSRGFEVERSSANQSWSQIGFVKSAGNSVTSQNYSYIDSRLETGSYSYRLKMVDLDGSFTYSNVVEVEIGTPATFSLSQNYPNPFNPATRIEYQVPFNANVKIELYSITGEKVATLVNSDLSAGFYTMDVDASVLSLASGVYFYRMTSTDVTGSKFMDTKKMVLLK